MCGEAAFHSLPEAAANLDSASMEKQWDIVAFCDFARKFLI